MPTPKSKDKHEWNLGDRVRIRHHANMIGQIVELRGPLGPGGAQIYRVEFSSDPEPTYAEVREDQLILLPPEK
jgi:hypothetical protein